MAQQVELAIKQCPVGHLLLGATATHLVICDWLGLDATPRQEIIKRLQRYVAIPIIQDHHALSAQAPFIQEGSSAPSGVVTLLDEAALQLDEYFQGTRQVFNLPIKTFGTPFQQQVWQQLQSIPYGITMTYKQQAIALGCPKAVRAVANANRLNALSIIIPCHRVMGSNHSLTGYAGGLNAKRWLIAHEQQHR